MTSKGWAIVVVVVAGALALRELFPKTVRIVTPPRIETRFDTVKTVDTLWLRRQVRVDTVLLERLSVTPPETVRVVPRLRGVTQMVVAPFIGDSTVLQGFLVFPTGADSGYALQHWQAQFWTAGPVRALAFVNGRPALEFGPPPKPPCGFGCTARHYLTGAAFGAALWEALRD